MPDLFRFDAERVLANVRQADDEDLLHRATVYRAGMEPEAIEIIERELARRGFDGSDIAAHRERLATEVLQHPDGVGVKCSFCTAPAVQSGWGWHRLFGRIPLLPRYLYRCKSHSS